MFRYISYILSLTIFITLSILAGAVFLFWHYGQDLPDYHTLANYAPPVTTRVYGGDGRLVVQYAIERRSYVPFDSIPLKVTQAVLSAEDKNFYQHPGIDITGVFRSILINVKNIMTRNGHRPIGASTITQQVARRFFLSNEVSLSRKIKEAILALRIEKTFTKQHILELYLNENYLGQGSYGIASAALNYFDKSLDELSIAECAFLASLLKEPGHEPQTFRNRRDYVLNRMLADGYITAEEAASSLLEPIVTKPRAEPVLVSGGEYFAEDIRRELASRYGEDALYKGGLVVRSTIDAALQETATKTLREGLIAYDRRHGWRGPITSIDYRNPDWKKKLSLYDLKNDLLPWRTAMVQSWQDNRIDIVFSNLQQGHIPLSETRWASQNRKHEDLFHPGDVIIVEPIHQSEDGKIKYPPDSYTIRQIPKVEGALVAMDPHTGRVLAMQGGFSFSRSQFNRATQAMRQPGSSFKPFVYMAALDNGYSPTSLVVDGPVEFDQGPGLPKWRPVNYHGGYLGPTTLRVGIEKSRNLMTIRLAADVGIDKVADYAEKFGVVDKLPHELSMSIGACDTTPMRMVTAYAQIVNGGRKITPTLIDRIQDKNGMTIYRHDTRSCDNCLSQTFNNQEMPEIIDNREQLIDPMTAYQMVHILEGVIDRGTGQIIKTVNKPLAGKTGTTNDSKDTWFVGFSPDLAVAVFVGYDDPISLGDRETGASVAAPIFRDFMMQVLKNKPAIPFRIPPGIRLIRIDATTGHPSNGIDKNTLYEAFKPSDLQMNNEQKILDNGEITSPDSNLIDGAESNSKNALPTEDSPPYPNTKSPEAGHLY